MDKRRDDAYTVISVILSVLIENSERYFYLLQHIDEMFVACKGHCS
jgi:hypothetical protein